MDFELGEYEQEHLAAYASNIGFILLEGPKHKAVLNNVPWFPEEEKRAIIRKCFRKLVAQGIVPDKNWTQGIEDAIFIHAEEYNGRASNEDS